MKKAKPSIKPIFHGNYNKLIFEFFWLRGIVEARNSNFSGHQVVEELFYDESWGMHTEGTAGDSIKTVRSGIQENSLVSLLFFVSLEMAGQWSQIMLI